jgi:hypothetical protein
MYYVPTKPCKNGHLLRYSAGGSCVSCKREAGAHRENKDRANARRRDDYRRNKDKWRRWDRKRRGLPEPLIPMPSLCECCGLPPIGKPLGIDHDHVTGKFRGWLCVRCNPAIGALGDSIEGLERAAGYLKMAYARN